jgi:molecular chaperone GrpE
MEKEDKKGTEKELNIEDLKKKLEECQKQKDEYLAGWQRSRADFLNYKKEEMERIGEILKYANTDLILKILPILDNFDLVEKKLPADLDNNEYIKGIFQIKNLLQAFLKNQGVEPITCLGEKFNPNFQEVVEEIETENQESGLVVEEIQKGYLLHGKILRPAKVRVTKCPETEHRST